MKPWSWKKKYELLAKQHDDMRQIGKRCIDERNCLEAKLNKFRRASLLFRLCYLFTGKL